MKTIESRFLPPKGYKAITILNYIFVRKGTSLNATDIQHEEIHWEQEKELLVVFFYVMYVCSFLIRLIKYKNWHTAYRNIPFELEAYDHQGDIGYLEYRKSYAWKP